MKISRRTVAIWTIGRNNYRPNGLNIWKNTRSPGIFVTNNRRNSAMTPIEIKDKCLVKDTKETRNLEIIVFGVTVFKKSIEYETDDRQPRASGFNVFPDQREYIDDE